MSTPRDPMSVERDVRVAAARSGADDMSERFPVRIKVYGGSLNLLPPGTTWRVERITEHQQPSGSIGEPMTEWTIIDFAPIVVGANAGAVAASQATDEGADR